jgi:hypothetical protein
MAPTTLVEGKQAIEAVKLALKQKETEAAQIVESATAKKSNQEAPARARLKAMAQEIKTNKETAIKAIVEEKASMVSAGSYDIYLGD